MAFANMRGALTALIALISVIGSPLARDNDEVFQNYRHMDPEAMFDGGRNAGIMDGRIATITKEKITDRDKIDATGQVVAMGFIYTERASTHSDENLVLLIQGRLNKQGFDPGPLDGLIGPRTRAAIRDYQRRYGLTVDGKPSRLLLERLEREAGSEAWQDEFNESADIFASPEQRRLTFVTSRLMRGAAHLCPDDMTPLRDATPTDPDLCGFPVKLTDGDEFLASTDGKKIKISRGALRFVSDDDELAFVLAHELTHILSGHSGAMRGSSRKEAELEADRLGIYIVARAGYSIETAARLLPRLGEALPRLNEPHAAYHTLATRTAAMRRAIEEIATSDVRDELLISWQIAR